MANVTMMEDDQSRLDYPIVRAIRESRIWNVITAYLRSQSVLCLLPISSLRFVEPTLRQYAIPFHQDGFGLPEGPNFEMLSVWLLLWPDVCGPEAPTVEFLAGPVRRNLAIEENPVDPHLPARASVTSQNRRARRCNLFSLGAGHRGWRRAPVLRI